MYYKRILGALPELIYVTEPDGLTGIFFNRAWYEYTGLTEEQAMQGWERIVNPHDISKVSSIIQKAIKAQEPYTVDVRLRCGDNGEFRWFLSKATPVFNEEGVIENYVGISTDINSIKSSIRDMETVYENELKNRISKLKEIENQLKNH